MSGFTSDALRELLAWQRAQRSHRLALAVSQVHAASLHHSGGSGRHGGQAAKQEPPEIAPSEGSTAPNPLARNRRAASAQSDTRL
jgi:hypothetical protein